MTQENETKEVISESQTKAEKPIRKGLLKYIRVYRFVPYMSAFVAIVLAVIALIELFNIVNIFPGLLAFQFMMLFGIFSMVSRMYYKMFEERYNKK